MNSNSHRRFKPLFSITYLAKLKRLTTVKELRNYANKPLIFGYFSRHNMENGCFWMGTLQVNEFFPQIDDEPIEFQMLDVTDFIFLYRQNSFIGVKRFFDATRTFNGQDKIFVPDERLLCHYRLCQAFSKK